MNGESILSARSRGHTALTFLGANAVFEIKKKKREKKKKDVKLEKK